jgi:hypothetical protein
MSALPNNDALARGFLAGALTALRKRAAARRKSAQSGIVRDDKGGVIVAGEAAADLAWARDLAAVADELEREARR